MGNINFIVYAPGYTDRSGGVIALHKLADILSDLGENSYIYADSTFTNNKATLISESTFLEYDQRNTMVIYPEITVGNPIQCNYVTRWLLYTPGYHGGDGIYGSNDLIYKYYDYFKAPDESKVSGELRTFNLKLDKFYNKNNNRSGECFIIKKGKAKIQNKHSHDSLNLDHYISDDYLIEVFNTKERFISYDSMTFHLQQAALCGCIPIVIPDENVNKEEFVRKAPVNKYGIAYGFEDIEYAKSTLHLVKPYLESMEQESITLIKNYIDHCYLHMNISK